VEREEETRKFCFQAEDGAGDLGWAAREMCASAKTDCRNDIM
jgi:hypothetical protein